MQASYETVALDQVFAYAEYTGPEAEVDMVFGYAEYTVGESLVAENWDALTPPALTGWTVTQVVNTGTAGAWVSAAHAAAPTQPNAAKFNSDLATIGNKTRLSRNAALDLSAYGAPALNVTYWQTNANSTKKDTLQVQVSTDGTNWYSLGPVLQRYNSSAGSGWYTLQAFDLSLYAGRSIYVALLATAAQGGAIYVDALVLTQEGPRSLPETVFVENWDGLVTPELGGWVSTRVAGSTLAWTSGTISTQSNPNFVTANTNACPNGEQARLWNANRPLDMTKLPGRTRLGFWVNNSSTLTFTDTITVQVSTDGVTWVSVGAAIPKYLAGVSTYHYWERDLSAYASAPVLYIGFLATVVSHTSAVAMDDVYLYYAPQDTQVDLVLGYAEYTGTETDVDQVLAYAEFVFASGGPPPYGPRWQ